MVPRRQGRQKQGNSKGGAEPPSRKIFRIAHDVRVVQCDFDPLNGAYLEVINEGDRTLRITFRGDVLYPSGIRSFRRLIIKQLPPFQTERLDFNFWGEIAQGFFIEPDAFKVELAWL